jgi:hypothetical protein
MEMHIDAMSLFVERFFAEANTLQWRKNRDYHPDKVAFLEIMQTASETGVTVEQDLWGRIRKQLSALRRFVIDGHVESEPPRQRMMDVAVYMGMLACWSDQKPHIIKGAAEFVRKRRPCESTPPCAEKPGSPELCDRCLFLQWLDSAR